MSFLTKAFGEDKAKAILSATLGSRGGGSQPPQAGPGARVNFDPITYDPQAFTQGTAQPRTAFRGAPPGVDFQALAQGIQTPAYAQQQPQGNNWIQRIGNAANQMAAQGGAQPMYRGAPGNNFLGRLFGIGGQ